MGLEAMNETFTERYTIHAWMILSVTLTIALECFLCLCEAVNECYSCMGDSVSHSNHYTRMFSVLL